MTDVSELIERVARAIEDSVWLQVGAEIDFDQAARAAIEASGVQSLSERVAVMEEALGEIAFFKADGSGADYYFEQVWRLVDIAKDALTKEGIENG